MINPIDLSTKKIHINQSDFNDISAISPDMIDTHSVSKISPITTKEQLKERIHQHMKKIECDEKMLTYL